MYAPAVSPSSPPCSRTSSPTSPPVLLFRPSRGTFTILGSVANLIVVETARAARVEIGFVEYCRVGVPLTLVTLIVGWLLLAFLPG